MTIEGIEINAIGIFHINEELSMKFIRREPGDWMPDLIVNHKLHTVGKPPECFQPTEEVLVALECAFQDWVFARMAELWALAAARTEQERGAGE